jgi:hypothetical protein
LKGSDILIKGFQVAGVSTYPELPQRGYIRVYHVHGYTQYMGTCKNHLDPNCRYLKNWKPERADSPTGGLSKTIMVEDLMEVWLADWMKCKVCWRENK